jgi:hypothetical protein
MNHLFDQLPSPKPQPCDLEEHRIDPAGLSFAEYRERCLWGAPDAHGSRACLDRKALKEPFDYSVREQPNSFENGEDPHYGTWDKMLEAGRSYLVGNHVSWRQFLRTHTSALTEWQRMAYHWCLAHPTLRLVFEARLRSRIYHIMKHGEFVEIGLPYHDYGGEKHWVSRDGKTRVLVNVD